jgi:hypothetical protein
MFFTTYVRNREPGLKTSLAYVRHILCGLKEHDVPEGYYQYVVSRVIQNNSELRPNVPEWDRLSGWCSEVG